MSIFVWAHFTHIPFVLQPMIELYWLASLVGKLKCFDTNTVAKKKLVYVKAFIAKGRDVFVDVNYSQKPESTPYATLLVTSLMPVSM